MSHSTTKIIQILEMLLTVDDMEIIKCSLESLIDDLKEETKKKIRD